MNDSEYNELRETSWRRKLTPAEEALAQAHWAAHPEAQAEWEEDLALTRQLQELPDAPLSSNFTSLVLQAVETECETVPHESPCPLGFWWSRWVRRPALRMAFPALIILLGAAVFSHHQNKARRLVARDVGEVIRVTTLPGPEVFENFDAIQQLQPVSLSSTDSRDDDLLAALR